MKIYTRTGDNGETSLLYGGRFRKSETIFEILGTLDELNAHLGLAAVYKHTKVKKLILSLQSDLFFIGAELADTRVSKTKFDFLIEKTTNLESQIDLIDSKLPQLKNFILPGGSLTASYLHLSRAICRRLERILVTYVGHSKKTSIDYSPLLKYINRLSDLLFVLSRYTNKLQLKKDIIWSGYVKKI